QPYCLLTRWIGGTANGRWHTGVIERHAQVGRGVDGVGKIQLVQVLPAAIIQHNGKMQVGPDSPGGGAVVIAGITETGTLRHKQLSRAWGKRRLNKVVAVPVGHVRVVQPEGAPRLERVVWYAHDERTAPAVLARHVAIVGGVDWSKAWFGVA